MVSGVVQAYTCTGVVQECYRDLGLVQVKG
jgi:hypothetical protein